MKYIKISAAILVPLTIILSFTGIFSHEIGRAIVIFWGGVFGAVMTYIQFKRGMKKYGFIMAGISLLMFYNVIDVLFFGG